VGRKREKNQFAARESHNELFTKQKIRDVKNKTSGGESKAEGGRQTSGVTAKGGISYVNLGRWGSSLILGWRGRKTA